MRNQNQINKKKVWSPVMPVSRATFLPELPTAAMSWCKSLSSVMVVGGRGGSEVWKARSEWCGSDTAGE